MTQQEQHDIAAETDRFMQGFHSSGIQNLLGMKIITAASGVGRVGITVDERLMHPQQIVHGGVIFTLADTAMSMALFPLLPSGTRHREGAGNIQLFAPQKQRMSNTMSIVGLHHAQICIPKGAEAEGRRFYCDLLGLPEIEKPASLQSRGGFWLQVGDRQVHVGTEGPVDRTATKAHLAYEVDNLEMWRAKLQVQGIALLEGVPIPGYDRFEFRDPFGNRVEFIQTLPLSSQSLAAAPLDNSAASQQYRP